jgi:broad-specificity NMP kinase
MKHSNVIILIAGLPGSGKSTLAKKINSQNNYKFTIIDDPKNFEQISSKIKENLIITDPHLCFEKNRLNAVKKIKNLNPNCEIVWLFFENNPNLCLRNSTRGDNTKDVDSFIIKLHKYYTIPKNSKIVPVYNQ